MNDVIRAAADIQEVCEREHWRFCLIGAVALLRWGEPRETTDVDLTLLTGFGDESTFVATLLRHFNSRIDNPLEFALTARVVLLRTESGVGLDVALGGLPFEEVAVARSSKHVYPGNVPLRTCSAEDLVVMKAFANRAKDWLDVEGIIIRQNRRLDWAYINSQLEPLVELKGELHILDELERLRIGQD